MENCVFDGDDPKEKPDINLNNGRFSRLSLKGSRFVNLEAKNAIFTGSIDLSGVMSAEDDSSASGCQRDEKKLCRCIAVFSGSRIENNFKASDAHFCVNPKESNKDFSAGGMPLALKLDHCQFKRDVALQPGFCATGGVSLNGAVIDGTVFMSGATICSEWDEDSLDMSMARVGGAVMLRALFRPDKDEGEPFVSEGCVRLYGCRIKGELYMAGAHLTAKEHNVALQGYLMEVGTVMRLIEGTETKENGGRFSSIPVKIEGHIILKQAQIAFVEMVVDSIKGQLILDEMKVNTAKITIKDCNDSVFFNDSIISNILEVDIAASSEEKSQQDQLQLNNTAVTGNTEIKVNKISVLADLSSIKGNLDLKVESSDRIDFKRSNIKAVEISFSGEPTKLILDDAYIDKSLKIESDKSDQYQKIKSISMKSIFVGQELMISELDLQGKLWGRYAKCGNLRLKINASDKINFENASIAGNVKIEELNLSQISNEIPDVSFFATEISNGLIINKVAQYCPEPPYSPDTSMQMHSLKLPFYDNWHLIEVSEKRNNRIETTSYLWGLDSKVVLLDGTSPPIHGVNADTSPKINAETAKFYLEFFCAYVWGGEEGKRSAFRLIRDESELGTMQLKKYPEEDDSIKNEEDPFDLDCNKYSDELNLKTKPYPDDEGSFFIRAVVQYEKFLFLSSFKIFRDGMVEMMDDEPIGELIANPVYRYETPHRSFHHTKTDNTSRRTIAGDWKEIEKIAEKEKLRIEYISSIHKIKKRFPEFSLKLVKTNWLNDDSGQAFLGNDRSQVKLVLSDFTYGAFASKVVSTKKDENVSGIFDNEANPKKETINPEKWKYRKKWLDMQFVDKSEKKPQEKSEFYAQPYEYLSQLYRKMGHTDDAIEVVAKRIDTETELRTRLHWQNYFSFKKGERAIYIDVSAFIYTLLCDVNLQSL